MNKLIRISERMKNTLLILFILALFLAGHELTYRADVLPLTETTGDK